MLDLILTAISNTPAVCNRGEDGEGRWRVNELLAEDSWTGKASKWECQAKPKVTSLLSPRMALYQLH